MLRRDAIAGAIAICASVMLFPSTAAAANIKSAASCAGPSVLAAGADVVADSRVDTVLCLVNGERTRRGLSSLKLSRTLSRSASNHSENMAISKFFSHVTPGGETLRQRVVRAGYARNSIVGETIGWGIELSGTPTELVRSFMSSASHRTIILDRRYREVGVGFAMAVPMTDMTGDGATLTLNFGRRM